MTWNEQIPRKTQLIKIDKETKSENANKYFKNWICKNFPTEKTACPYGCKSKLFQKYNEKHLSSVLNDDMKNSETKTWQEHHKKNNDRPTFLVRSQKILNKISAYHTY